MKKNVKILSIFIAILMLFQLTACNKPTGDSTSSTTSDGSSPQDTTSVSGDIAFTAGTYKSNQTGHNGFIDYEVTLSDSAITDIKAVKHYETVGVSDKALKDLPQAIIESQTLNVDTITGATLTSLATIRAVEDCIKQAGADPALLKPEVAPVSPEAIEKTADVIIVGGGGSGLAAAVAAVDNNASVIIVEKAGYVGGNTLVSGGIYNAPHEELQKQVEMTPGLISMWEDAIAEEAISEEHAALQAEVKAQLDAYKASGETYLLDSNEWFALQTWNGGDKIADLDLVKILTYSSLDALNWVVDKGFEYLPDTIKFGGGSMYTRTHMSVKPLGTGYIGAYLDSLASKDAEIVYNTEVTELIVQDGKVVGAKGIDKKGNTYTFNANKSVVLSTGGFAGNLDLVQEYNTSGKWPDLSTRKSTNLPAIKGDGIKLAKDAGAGFRDMEQIQLLFICDPVTGIATTATFQPQGADGAIFLNKEGKRFVREDGRRDDMALGIMAQTDGVMYMLQNADSGVDLDTTTDLGGVPMKDLIEMGYVFYGETLEEACTQAGLPADAVAETIADFNKLVDENATADEFERATFSIKLENGPWYIVARAPSVHHTMGGVTISETCQVLNEKGEVIPGLFAAGEVVGGVHGGNRLGGNAIVDTVVFGRLAGQEASK